MSRLDDRVTAPLVAAPAPASPREIDERRLEMQGYVTMLPFLALHSATQGKWMPRIVRGAQLFLITFAFVAPVLLMLGYA
jgi:hypothetical protein